MFFDWKNAFLYLTILLDFLLGVIVISKKHKKSEAHVAYGLFVLWVILWTLGIALFRQVRDYSWMLFWNREFIVTAALIGSSFLHFSFIFPKPLIKLTKIKRFLIYIPNIFVLLGVWLPSVLIEEVVTQSWGNESILGRGYFLFGGYFTFLSVWALINLWKNYTRVSGLEKKQTIYVAAGLLISLLFGATFNLIFILLGNYKWIWLGPYASFIMLAVIGYTIFRYRLMDIRIAVRKVFAYIILGIFSYGFFYAVAYTYLFSFGDVFAAQGFIVGTVIALIFAAATPIVFKSAVGLSNKFLYTNIYNAQETFRKTTEKLTTIVKLQDLVDTIINTITDTLGINKAAILMSSKQSDSAYTVLGTVGFDKRNGISLVRDNFLTRWLDKHAKPLVYEELFLYARDASSIAQRTQYETLQKRMEDIKAALCLPFIVRGHLHGLIVLGEKKGGDAYTKEDMELLETLANQAAIALENAVLYNQMELLVAARTRDLEEKNIHLEKLLKMRSEFLDIASHQLRTPVSVIKGYVSMLIDGDYNDTDKQTREEAYRAIEQKTAKLVQIINDILYASELDTGSAGLHKREYAVIEICPYLQKIVENHKQTAKEKNIALVFEESAASPLCVRASERYLDVILDNLIDNGLHYTPPNGTVTIRAIASPERVRIEVKDTGIGISKMDQKELFNKFKRGANANNMHTDGSGLGLFIVKKMIQAQPGGRVGFESKLNKGSVFWIELERVAANK